MTTIRHWLALALAALVFTGCAAHGPRHQRVLLDTSMGAIEIELDEARAPVTVANFLSYVDRGAYDGTIIHRCVPGFVVQGGGHEVDLSDRAKTEGGGEDKDPRILNEWTNGLKNLRGTVGMARETEPDSATRQFYFNLSDNARLDQPREVSGNAGYCVFAHVTRGMDVIDAMAAVRTKSVPALEMENIPVDPIIVRSARRVR
jgi:peptidyl-prolyl cis-trans isomerase A (cyclophilin A)